MAYLAKPTTVKECILIDKDYPESLIHDIHAAKKTIDIETYIFSNDEMGKEIAEALIQAAQRGLRIRLLVDGIGTYNWKNAFSNKLEEAGIHTKVYHPIIFLLHQWFSFSDFFNKIFHLLTHINSRNHRKTCMIDHAIAYVGSANITEATYIKSKKIYWHDISVRLTGTDLTELQYAFDKAWGCVSFKKRMQHLFIKTESDPVFRLNYSLRKRRHLYKDLLKKIQQSQKRIWINNAYFFPTLFMLKQLIQAHRRGIDVCILLPAHTDVMGASLLSKFAYISLLKAGISIKKYGDGILHSKILIIDDWFCLGSSNLNYRSLKRDLEVDVKIQTPAAKEIVGKYFQTLYDHAHPLEKKETQQLSLYEKIILGCLWLIKSWY